jgi:hypothetical protein
MRVMVAHTRTNLYHTPVMEYFELLTDWRGARWAEAYFNDNEIVMYQKSRRDSVFFVGALQIDAFGNSNLIGLGRDPRRLTLRGPGAIATTTNASHVRRFYLFVNEHSPRVFVPRCDFVSTVGWGEGGSDARRRLGLPGVDHATASHRSPSSISRRRPSACGSTRCIRAARSTTSARGPLRALVLTGPVTDAPTVEEFRHLRRRVTPAAPAIETDMAGVLPAYPRASRGNLSKAFGATRVVSDVSFRVAGGSLLTLLGPSGSGKTTSLRMIAGFEEPTEGQILVADVDITERPAHKRNIGVVFQQYALFPHLTVFQNIAYPLEMRRSGKAEIRNRVE